MLRGVARDLWRRAFPSGIGRTDVEGAPPGRGCGRSGVCL
jgi:hypothetical protein